MDLSVLSDLPACSTACLAAWCSPVVEACLCANTQPHAVPWDDDLNACLESNCTFAEQIVTCGATWKQCKVPLDETSLTPLIIITFLVQLSAFIMRVWSMLVRSTRLGYDDVSITIAFILLLCFVPILCLIDYYGFYANVYTGTVHNLDKSSICFFVFKVFYALAMGWTKIAIVFLYFRILEGRKSRFILWATQAAILLVMCSFIIALGNACKPIWAYWAFSFDVANATCLDLWDWGGYYTGLNLALDIWMIVVPVYTISKLKMDKKAKMGVIAMFCLGFVTMAMTIMRFVEMRRNGTTFLADDIMDSLIWSTLEPTVAFVVACMPAIRLVLRSRFPTIRNSISFKRSGPSRREMQNLVSSSSGDYPPAHGYRQTGRQSQQNLFETHGTVFQLSPIEPAKVTQDSRD
ncbi:unnamed protein product [Discula destructiva]